ncbi:hypothetical protein [Sphingomonas sp. ID0503]|uniref:hypothetical protein n=1 Tax=Sphingomonas sp. ID0503 TaxID=3399691 RepID=UPI003AFB7488
MAEEVSDPNLAAPALAAPGTIIRRLRDAPPGEDAPDQTQKRNKRKAAPPSRQALDRAEKAVEQLKHEQAEALDRLDHQIAALKRQRQALVKDQAEERATAEEVLAKESAAYDKRMSK